MPITPQELAILGMSPGDGLPSGGRIVHGVTFSNTGTSEHHTKLFLAEFRRRWNVGLQPGGLNVNLRRLVEWEEPFALLPGTTWEFIPVILNGDQAIGVAFRGNRQREDLLEIASPVALRARLGCPKPKEIAVTVRMLPGVLLKARS